VYRPEDIRTRLGISPTTLRRYAVDFEAWLSASAKPSITETGALGARRYTADDLAVLAAVKRAYDAGNSTADVQAALRDGTLRPAHVVDNNAPWPLSPPLKPTTVDPESATVGLPALMGVDGEPFVAQLAALNAALPALGQALDQAQRDRAEALAAAERQQAAFAALAEQSARTQRELQYQVEALRQERAALAQARADLEHQRASPPEVPVAAATVGQRLRRLFTGGS
jgi:DNA-binding transcriptional MerR regulator